MTMTKKLWIGIAVLALFLPLGVIVPRWFNSGGAWGEWGLDEIQKAAGFVPEGMKRLAEIWKAPLSDYSLPNQSKSLLNESLSYLITGIIGIAVIAGVMYLLTKLLVRKNGSR
jgi:hypothetical protein